ncbi:phage integrase N-terminal SAM-like domain-containing protein [Thermosynechococcaceae cyanobacterium BACA0444]|uniref:Phage integrase N-terminal SAM-like domain-containing protein n=1 Tax=Pseudocalidococcus azoricus BACA0444 TaxID=2918990 RepID=A0AAE4FS51_9CYAN|nr:phage integrase N-terminal SAM-like domain-containing protein [Pseudocalidococcus azoricus]MDS3861106.1 phage integrase N-terminal SAM-like domain-containing protein [Pseudocalidococcus azoricus BACA0444]
MIFYNKQHPQDMGAEEITAFLSHLAVEDKVSAEEVKALIRQLSGVYRLLVQLLYGMALLI